MEGSGVIAAYERVLAIMQQMHEAARNGHWDELVALERSCRSVVEKQLMDGDTGTLPPADAQRKMAIIRQILALDAAIRDMTEPWLRHLQSFLGSREREKKLHAAYGAADGV